MNTNMTVAIHRAGYARCTVCRSKRHNRATCPQEKIRVCEDGAEKLMAIAHSHRGRADLMIRNAQVLRDEARRLKRENKS